MEMGGKKLKFINGGGGGGGVGQTLILIKGGIGGERVFFRSNPPAIN